MDVSIADVDVDNLQIKLACDILKGFNTWVIPNISTKVVVSKKYLEAVQKARRTCEEDIESASISHHSYDCAGVPP